jgi:ABC-2 type transport system ATP-binding protein
MLQFLKFKKSYGSFCALQITDFKIEKGIYWVKGNNGSGKSTLLKSIAGIVPFDGDIILNGKNSIKRQPINFRREVNFGEAEPIFPGFLTGIEMINMFVSSKNGKLDQAQSFIESMQLEPYIKQPIATYSNGTLKKLSILLAFIGNPRIILLDEPFITLDQQALKVVCRSIINKWQQEGISFLLSSHIGFEDERLSEFKTIMVESQTIQFQA